MRQLGAARKIGARHPRAQVVACSFGERMDAKQRMKALSLYLNLLLTWCWV